MFFFLIFPSKVSNGLDKYLPRHSIFNDCLESDVHRITSEILSILTDSPKTMHFPYDVFGRFSNLELEMILRNSKRQSF